MNQDFEIAIEKARKYCLRGEKCRQDVRKKLYDWKIPPDWHEKILDTITEERFIDEERFAKSFANDKCYLNKWGKIKIRYTLLSKNIDENIINKALENIDNKRYKEIFHDVSSQKLKLLKNKENDSYKIKQKLVAFLSRRGFEPDLINDAELF